MSTSMGRFRNTLIRYTKILLSTKDITPLHEYDQFTAAIMSDTEFDVESGYQLLLVDTIDQFVEMDDLINLAMRRVCQKFDRNRNINKLQDLIIFIRLLTYVKPCLKDGASVARSRTPYKPPPLGCVEDISSVKDILKSEDYKESVSLTRIFEAIRKFVAASTSNDSPLKTIEYDTLLDIVDEETVYDDKSGISRLPVDTLLNFMHVEAFITENVNKLLNSHPKSRRPKKLREIIAAAALLNSIEASLMSKEELEGKE